MHCIDLLGNKRSGWVHERKQSVLPFPFAGIILCRFCGYNLSPFKRAPHRFGTNVDYFVLKLTEPKKIKIYLKGASILWIKSYMAFGSLKNSSDLLLFLL